MSEKNGIKLAGVTRDGIPGCTKIADSVALGTRADSARVEPGYETLDADATKTAFQELDAILDGLAEQVVHTLDQVIPRLAEMQALLSQRGKARKKVLKQAGLPSWTAYANKYAKKLSCSLRTVQDHIMVFNSTGKSGPSRQKNATPRGKPLQLDARQQATLVKAQLAANDMVAALKSGGDLQTAVAKYRKLAVAPARLDSYLNTLNLEPDWKQVLVELVDVLEKFGEKLPLAVLNQKRAVERLLNAKNNTPLPHTAHAGPPKKNHKRSKLDEDGNRCRIATAEGEMNAPGTLKNESDADAAIESLSSPATGLVYIGAARMIPASVAHVGAEFLGLHEGVA
jgi:hypothetical protein